MPSIREFHTAVEKLDSGDDRITLRTPLRAEASQPNVGWITKITFTNALLTGDRSGRLATIKRFTSPVIRTPNGLRRKLLDRPQTTEKVTIYSARTTCTTSTTWSYVWTSAESVTNGLSFRPADLIPLLRGCVETNEGRPLVDWLTENTTEFAPYLTEAGWLPATEDEFHSVKRQRDAEFAKSAEDNEILVFDDDNEEDDPDLDRWR